jgi:hypothetical protein
MLPKQLRDVGKLHLKQLNADQGWLVLGWRQPAAGENVALASHLESDAR